MRQTAEESLPAAVASPRPCEDEAIIRAWIESQSGPGGPWADKDPKSNLKWVTLDGDFNLLELAHAVRMAERERNAKVAEMMIGCECPCHSDKTGLCPECCDGGVDACNDIAEKIRKGLIIK